MTNFSSQSKKSSSLFQQQFDTLSKPFPPMPTFYYLTDLINAAQSEIAILQTSLDHQESLSFLLTVSDPRLQQLDDRMARIQQEISDAKAHKKDLTAQLEVKQLMLAHGQNPDIWQNASSISGTLVTRHLPQLLISDTPFGEYP